MHPELYPSTSIASPALGLENSFFSIACENATNVAANTHADFFWYTTTMVGEIEKSNFDAFLSEVMALYHDETDPEAFAQKYQEIVDRYPDLTRSPESQLLNIQPTEPETQIEPTSSGLASVAFALLAGRSKKILPAILATSLALAACSDKTQLTPEIVPSSTPVIELITPSPVRPTPEPMVTSTPPPVIASPTEIIPTETPIQEQTYLDYDPVYGVQIEELLATSDIVVTDSDIDFPGLIDPVKNPNGIRQVKELDANLLSVLAPFVQADGTLKLPIDATTFTCRFRQDQNGVMRAEWFFTTVDNRVIFLSEDMTKLYYGELIDDVLVPTIVDGRVVTVNPPQIVQPTRLPAEQQPTGVPPEPGATSIPPVVAPTATTQPEQPPTTITLAECGTVEFRNNSWICSPGAWHPELANPSFNPNVIQVIIKVRNLATRQWVENYEYNGDSVGQATGKVNELILAKYKPFATNWYQSTSIGNPTGVGVHPHAVILLFDLP